MYRNTKNNLLYFRFPQDFIPLHIEEKYNTLLKQHQCAFKSTREYINSLMINFRLPGLDYDLTSQEHARSPRNFRGGLDIFRSFDKTFSIDIRLTEGYLSYFILLETIIYWNDQNTVNYLPKFTFKTMNLRGFEIATVEYSEVLFNSIGELTLTSSDVEPTFNSFTIGFKANLIDIKPLVKLNL